MNPNPEITYRAGDPVNRLFFAINHWVSTGDHIGEGIAADGAPGWRVLFVPVRIGSEVDYEDFRRFVARLSEIKTTAHITDLGQQGEFRGYGLHVEASDMHQLAEDLRSAPGPLGWGSYYEVIKTHE